MTRVAGTPVAMLLLGDPTGDARVIKTVRSLQGAGYRVTLYCVAEQDPARPLPDLAGAVVHWVRAPRPLAWLAARMRRPRASDGEAPAVSGPVRVPGPARRLLADLRAWLGTLWLNLALARAAARRPAAVIHANDLDTLLSGALLHCGLGAALLYDSHELYPDMFATSSPLYVGLWRLLEHRLIGAAGAVVTVNRSIAGELQRRHRLPRLPDVVMNCPPIADFPPAQPAELAGEQRLIFHGRYQAERGLEIVIRAMAQIDRRAVLCLRGSGPLRPALEDLAVASGVRERVRFLDPLPPDRLVADLVGGRIGLVPYLPTSLNNYYCTPNKLFEYMMGGLAVVAGDLPELRRAVAGAGAGVLYPPGDPQALARAVNALLADPAQLACCASAARAAAVSLYTWEAQEAVLLGVYARLAASPDRPARAAR